MENKVEGKKYNRSKMLADLFSKGCSVEEAVKSCLDAGDKNKSCLEYAAKRVYREKFGGKKNKKAEAKTEVSTPETPVNA